MFDIEPGRLLQYALLAVFIITLVLFVYFRLGTPVHLRPPRKKHKHSEEQQRREVAPRTTHPEQEPAGFGFDDDMSDYMDDARTEATELPAQADEVEFSAIAPRRVGSGEVFRIFIHVERVPDTSSGPDADETFTAIVMQVQRGERLSLVLESRNSASKDPHARLGVDAPFQSLTWRGGSLVLDFRVRAPVVEREMSIRSRLWLTAGNEVMGIPILKGKLDIATSVHPRLKSGGKEHQLWKRDQNSKAISHKELEAHFELARLGGVGSGAVEFATAFICHAHADKEIVETYMAALEAAGIRCFHDEFDFVTRPHWLRQAARFIAAVDVIYIFWSRVAATRPSIHSELRIIHALIAGRERENAELPPEAPKKPNPVVFVVVLDDVPVMLPDWFKEDLGFTRRMRHFGSHQKAKERPRLSELADQGSGHVQST